MVSIFPLDTSGQERRVNTYFFHLSMLCELGCINLQARKKVIPGLVWCMYKKTVEVDFPLNIVNGMSGEIGCQVKGYVSIFVFFCQLKLVGTKISYFYPQVEIGYSLLGNKTSVYADFSVFIVE